MSDAAEKTQATEPPAPPAPPAKRKYRRRTRHKATGQKIIPLKVPEEFAGMTELECCAGCSAARCLISGVGVCGHPLKGGQVANDQTTLSRYERAKKALAHRKIDLTKV